MISIDRRHFIATLGGAAAVQMMNSEAKADALEHYLMEQLNQGQKKKFPTAAEVEAQIETRSYRRGVGNLFLTTKTGETVKRLPPLPDKPTIVDFFKLRMEATANHVLQSANRAVKNGMPEESVVACLLHDTVHCLMKPDHGFWGQQLYGPYVSDKIAFAIRGHQALRFFDDKEAGYALPDIYRQLFGEDYVPLPHIFAEYKMLLKHKWYGEARAVAVNDLYAFEPGVTVSLEPFIDILYKHFKQPKEGLGNDGSPVAHMWRTIAYPDQPV